MKEIILEIPKDDLEWVDCPARAWIEAELLKYQGKMIKVKITLYRPHYRKYMF